MDKTPRKSPRLNKHAMAVDSPSIESSRSMNELTKTPNNRISNNINECIVIDSSASFIVPKKNIYVGDRILPHDSDFEDEIPLVRVKEKVFEGKFVHDSDFKDEVPLAKRLRINNVPYLKNIAGGSGISVSKPLNPKGPSSTLKKRKTLIQPLKIKKKQSRWCLYINMNVFVDITERLAKLIVEFRAVIGFKCGGVMDFDHDPNSTSKLLSRYFQRRWVDYGRGLSGQYFLYSWGNLSFFNLRHSISSQMARDLDHVKFEGFPLALQIWLSECCNKVDTSIAIRSSNRTPRIFNWDISKHKIFFDHLKKGMFRKYENQYMFKDVLFMEEELDVIEVEKLSNLNHSAFKKKSKRGSFARQSDNVQVHNDEMDNDKEVPHNSAHHAESDLSSTISKDLVKFAQEIDKALMDSSFKHIIEELKSIQKEGSTNKDAVGGVIVDFELNRNTPTLDDFVMPNMRQSQLVALETGQTYVSSLVDVEYGNICVTPLKVVEAGKTKFNQFGVGEGENTHHVRTKIPGKYAQSPYTNLSESGGTSVNTMKYCSWRHPFGEIDGLVSPFGLSRTSYLWGDLHVDVIMYYLRKFCKYGPNNSARVTTTDPFLLIGLYKSMMRGRPVVAQYIRGDKILSNTPWVDVDHVCIQVNSSIAFHCDYGLYTCAFVEYVCHGERYISMSIFNSKNLRLRFGALLWKYGKMKIDTEYVSEDEASKQGGMSNRRVKE
ncbi:hypothetical protein H5410_028332 [Solanum commersonii]|uniref:Uncharacterized protein n=1 Tax=Solanum commersonii TaxID=4109 RepID=A0A9J5Z4I4_SOLCO|nr:hypothetical protein H5410_028332 [Solanum commersonii]